ncbi:MAG: SPFH domain-containing protein [Minisyncoccia bacterium]
MRKRFGKKLPGDNPIAFHKEAGYQAELLMPGLRFKLCFLYAVTKHPWVQVPAGQIGVVIAQVGKPTPMGVKSAVYKSEFGNFTDLDIFITKDGQKGVQRPVLSPGTLAPIHPVAFLVITKLQVFGVPVSEELRRLAKDGELTFKAWDQLKDNVDCLDVTRIEPKATEGGHVIDMVGVVIALEGESLSEGDIASRLDGFNDVKGLESSGATNAKLIETILGSKNVAHNSYQDFQTFLDKGGKIGLQHDPLLYGAYNLNPFLVRVEKVPMLVVEQGQVAVIKAYVGLPTEDTSGTEFKFGSLVKPGHRGIWEEPLRTGKYPINPRIYQAEVVPTAILKLDWSEGVTGAHKLDEKLSPIVAKSCEGFVFTIDLQVLIHVPDTKAPYVISMVGSMLNLVNEVLQAAVGNLFRDKLGGMPAVTFIETRQKVQEEATDHISRQLEVYMVETKGVYIQNVMLPEELVKVLTEREIANQQVATFKMQRTAQDQRIETEQATGKADMQKDLAKSAVGIDIKKNNADAREQEGRGEAKYVEQTGLAQAAVIKAQGVAKAEGFRAQNEAIGQTGTMLVNIATVLADKGIKIVPEILVAGGGGSLDGLAATLTGMFSKQVPALKSESPTT